MKEKYELGIYNVVSYNNIECERVVIENATSDECFEKMKELLGTLEDKQIFDIYDVNTLQSWSYYNDGSEVDNFTLYEKFGFDENEN